MSIVSHWSAIWKGLSLWRHWRCICVWRTDVYQWITYTEHIGLTHCSRWLAMAALAWCTKPSFAKLARWLPSRKYFRSAWNLLSQNLYCWRTRWILEYLQDKRFKNRELQIMRRLDHCNIVSLLYFFYTSGEKKVFTFHLWCNENFSLSQYVTIFLARLRRYVLISLWLNYPLTIVGNTSNQFVPNLQLRKCTLFMKPLT